MERKNKMPITEEQFKEYLSVQEDGLYNMFDPNARKLSDMSKRKWLFIVTNYSKISEVYNG